MTILNDRTPFIEKPMNKSFHKHFKKLFDATNSDYKELARVFSTAPGTVSRWYNGYSSPASIAQEKILDYLYKKLK